MDPFEGTLVVKSQDTATQPNVTLQQHQQLQGECTDTSHLSTLSTSALYIYLTQKWKLWEYILATSLSLSHSLAHSRSVRESPILTHPNSFRPLSHAPQPSRHTQTLALPPQQRPSLVPHPPALSGNVPALTSS